MIFLHRSVCLEHCFFNGKEGWLNTLQEYKIKPIGNIEIKTRKYIYIKL